MVFGCVAEDRPLYLAESLFLLQSLRWFGGALAGAPFVVCVVEEVDDDYAALFQELGASVRVVERVSARHSHSNKLRFLEAPELADCDVAVLLDCDTIVVGDPLPWLDCEQFQARMAGNPSVPHSVFERLFGHFGLGRPQANWVCNPGGQPTVWYVNGGVLAFPRSLLGRFGGAWREWNERLLAHIDLLGPYQDFCDQASMTLAMAADPVPFGELPLGLNYPVRFVPPAGDRAGVVPVILHHHHWLDHHGCLRPSPFPPVQDAIERYNRRFLSELCGVLSDRMVWDFHRFANEKPPRPGAAGPWPKLLR